MDPPLPGGFTNGENLLVAAIVRPAIGIAVFIFALFFAVMFHEFGHYTLARKAGMKVSEFFFGFGPRLWSFTRRYYVLYDRASGRELRTVRIRHGATLAATQGDPPTDPAPRSLGAAAAASTLVEPEANVAASRKKGDLGVLTEKCQEELQAIVGKKGSNCEIGVYETETEFGIKALPLGGYVRIVGMDPFEEVEAADKGHTYADKSYLARGLAILAGPMANILVAFVLLWALAMAGQLPTQEHVVPVIGQVSPPAGCETFEGTSVLDGASCSTPTPARLAGLVDGDRFVAINGSSITTWDEVKAAIAANPGKTIEMTVERQGQILLIPVTVGERPAYEGEAGPQPFIGIVVGTERRGENPLAASVTSVKYMGLMAGYASYEVYKFFTPERLTRYFGLMTGNKDPEANNTRFVSPVGVARLSAQAAQEGWATLLMILVIFNLFLGIFNLVPLLPLDGGHLAVVAYEKVASSIMKRKVRVNMRKLVPVMAAVIILFVLIGVSSIYLDIVNPIANPFR